MPAELAGLTRSEWELVLNEACFSSLDAQIAKCYLIEGQFQADVGSELDRVRRTVYNRLHKSIYPRAQEVARKLHII